MACLEPSHDIALPRLRVKWLPEIGTTFQSMAKEGEPDSSRPRIEFYRSEKEAILFLPLK